MERDARSSRRFRDRAVLSSVKSSSRSNHHRHSSSRSQKAAFSMETDYTSGFSYPEPTPAPKKQRRRFKLWRRRLFAIFVILLLVLCCPILLVWNQYDFVRLALSEQQVMQQQQPQMLADFVIAASFKDSMVTMQELEANSTSTSATTGITSSLAAQQQQQQQQRRQLLNVTTITSQQDGASEAKFKPENPSQQIDKLLRVNLYQNQQKQKMPVLPSQQKDHQSRQQQQQSVVVNNFQQNEFIQISDTLEQCANILSNPNSLKELVYWEHHPQDFSQLPLQQWYNNNDATTDSTSTSNSNNYLTFEPDTGGFSSQRMVLEHMIALAYALGRTLVLPPRQGMRDGTLLSYEDYFDLREAQQNYKGLTIITMEEFLGFVAIPGYLDPTTTTDTTAQGSGGGGVPPFQRTNWDSAADIGTLYQYLRTVGTVPFDWDPQTCILGYRPDQLKKDLKRIWKRIDGRPPPLALDFQGKPTSVKAPAIERLREFLAERRQVCNPHTDALVLHIPTTAQGKSLLFAPFYSFFFFDDYHDDLLVKRMIRDYVRYNDVIVCAAARIVDWLRTRGGSGSGGIYDAMHIRGPSFEDAHSDVNTNPAWIIHDIAKYIPKGATLYIATDHTTDMTWFDPLRDHYKLYFASDFKGVFDSMMPWYLEMVEQLICARSRTFVGTYYSAFSGYTNRLRGYYSERDYGDTTTTTDTDDTDGAIQSYYASPVTVKKDMRLYRALRKPLWMREFPTAWRDLNQDVAAVEVVATTKRTKGAGADGASVPNLEFG